MLNVSYPVPPPPDRSFNSTTLLCCTFILKSGLSLMARTRELLLTETPPPQHFRQTLPMKKVEVYKVPYILIFFPTPIFKNIPRDFRPDSPFPN